MTSFIFVIYNFTTKNNQSHVRVSTWQDEKITVNEQMEFQVDPGARSRQIPFGVVPERDVDPLTCPKCQDQRPRIDDIDHLP
jgi:hypothetical protein